MQKNRLNKTALASPNKREVREAHGTSIHAKSVLEKLLEKMASTNLLSSSISLFLLRCSLFPVPLLSYAGHRSKPMPCLSFLYPLKYMPMHEPLAPPSANWQGLGWCRRRLHHNGIDIFYPFWVFFFFMES